MRWRSASELGQKYTTQNYPSQGTQICKLHGPSIKPRKCVLAQAPSSIWDCGFWSLTWLWGRRLSQSPVLREKSPLSVVRHLWLIWRIQGREVWGLATLRILHERCLCSRNKAAARTTEGFCSTSPTLTSRESSDLKNKPQEERPQSIWSPPMGHKKNVVVQPQLRIQDKKEQSQHRVGPSAALLSLPCCLCVSWLVQPLDLLRSPPELEPPQGWIYLELFSSQLCISWQDHTVPCWMAKQQGARLLGTVVCIAFGSYCFSSAKNSKSRISRNFEQPEFEWSLHQPFLHIHQHIKLQKPAVPNHTPTV